MQNGSLEPVRDTQATEVKQFDITPYTDGKPFSLERSTRRIRRHIDTIDMAIFKIGKELLWIKKELPHGEFIQWLRNEMKFPERRAQECMQIARWVIESKSPHARAFLHRIAGNSKTKMLLAIANTTDQDVDKAMETGHFWGRPIDEIKDTPTGVLRQEYRTGRAKNEQRLKEDPHPNKDRRLNAKTALEQKAPQAVEHPTPLAKINRAFLQAIESLSVLTEAVEEMYENPKNDAILASEDWQRLSTNMRHTLDQKIGTIYGRIQTEEPYDFTPYPLADSAGERSPHGAAVGHNESGKKPYRQKNEPGKNKCHLLTTREAAERAGVKIHLLYGAVKDGRIAYTRKPGRYKEDEYRFDPDDVDRFATTAPKKPTTPKQTEIESADGWVVIYENEVIFTGTLGACLPVRAEKEQAGQYCTIEKRKS